MLSIRITSEIENSQIYKNYKKSKNKLIIRKTPINHHWNKKKARTEASLNKYSTSTPIKPHYLHVHKWEQMYPINLFIKLQPYRDVVEQS